MTSMIRFAPSGISDSLLKLGVGTGVGVAVGSGVEVGAGVAVGLGVGVTVGSGVAVGSEPQASIKSATKATTKNSNLEENEATGFMEAPGQE